MKTILMLLLLFSLLICSHSYSQKKYGYAVLYARCSKTDPQRDRIYFSPIIELSVLNFKEYIAGIDPSIPAYSVRYYNYAILKWFEKLLKEKYNVAINDPEKYERQSTAIVFNPNGNCNADNTNTYCFFTDKLQLVDQRNLSIIENKSPAQVGNVCEVTDLQQ